MSVVVNVTPSSPPLTDSPKTMNFNTTSRATRMRASVVGTDTRVNSVIDNASDAGLSATGPAATFVPPIIPASHPARTLVLCFDGTGDQFDNDVCSRP